ncbi:dUTP diphosphatase [uncultured Corynebacterium sp.]|uniref:dUTP diphosphatase n=1 Tax=uncultured Corynebacterium sp. TaxID=159447 RepID=UPI0025993309|nr:dUTP diphosphatase [uncultured Corynebacterium sp.]
MQANLPTNYAHDRRAGDAGLDLRAAGDTPHHIPVGATRVIPTGITGDMLNLDLNHVALICSRSGLAANGIMVTNSPGIIDAGYRGELQVIVTNLGRSPFTVDPGSRIAQLLIMPHLGVQYFGDGTAERGAQGFGSSGTT